VKAYDPGIAALRARRQAGGTGGTAGGH
jgi:hypothetical protein